MNRFILMSFDVEEFDIPFEWNNTIEDEDKFLVGYEGLKALYPFLKNSSLRYTLFTTANFASKYPSEIRNLSVYHEIASHSYYHTDFKNEDLILSRIKLEEITQKSINGLRMPRMKILPANDILNAGYTYDASINPILLPGRYNNLKYKRIPHFENELLRIPASVSPVIRIPLFWLSFKNFPYSYFLQLVKTTIKRDGHISLYFHPWEFIDVSKWGLPKYVTKGGGNELLNKFSNLLNDLKMLGDFITMQEFAEHFNKKMKKISFQKMR